MSPADCNNEDTGDRTYGLSSLSEKTTMSYHLQMSLQKQHVLVSYFNNNNNNNNNNDDDDDDDDNKNNEDFLFQM